MAKMDLITTLTLNSAGFEGGIDKAKQKTAEMKAAIISNTKDMETGVQGLGGVFSQLGNSVGEAGSQITGVMSSIMSAATPIAALVAIIGLLAEAWKKSKEEIEAYNKESDKAKYGASAFSADSGKALKDTQKRATGGIKEGAALETDAYIKIGQLQDRRTELNSKETDEKIAQYRLQVIAGKQMGDDNEKLLKSIGYNSIIRTSIEDETTWTLKYNDLLAQQEQLNVDRVKSETAITAEEAKLYDLALKIKLHTTDTAERKKLEKEYEQIALNIQNERLGLLDRDEKISTGLFQMTGQDEKVKMNGLNIEKQKQDVNLQYSQTMDKTARMQNSITTDTAKEFALRKQINDTSEAGFKLGEKNVSVGGLNKNGTNNYTEERAGFANTQQLNKPAANDVGGGATDANKIKVSDLALRAYGGTLKSTIDLNKKYSDSQERVNNAFDGFADSVAQGASSLKEFGKELQSSAKHAIGAYIAESLAATIKNSMESAGNPLLGIVIAGIASGLVMTLFNSIPSFSQGGIVGGTSYEGDRVPIMANSGEMILNKSQQNMLGGGQLTTKVSGTDLLIVLNNTQRKINGFA
jgi:hypothetical protein